MARSIAAQTIKASSLEETSRNVTAVRSNSFTSTRQARPTLTTIKKPVITLVKEKLNDADHSGDVRAQDIIDASRLGITSTDGNGFTTLNGVTGQFRDGSRNIKITIGKYDGTNWGIALGSSTSSPEILLGQFPSGNDGLTFNGQKFITMKSASRIIFWNSGNDRSTQIGYVIDQFQISSDTTDGIVLTGNSCITKAYNPSYGGGSGVLFIGDAQANPSSNPSNGGILYVNSGALTYRGSGGTTTVIAPA